MEQVRSFIAIELPEEVKASLTRLQSRLKFAGRSDVKWVSPNSIHLTLQFLGDVPADKIESIVRAMEEGAKGTAPFKLEIKGLGAFPNLRRVQVVWVGVEGDLETLLLLQKRIETGLVPLGFTPEKRAFSPHLTLARVRETASLPEREQLGKLISGMEFESSGTIEVTSLSLMRSQLTPSGAIYTQIGSVKLS
jgi:RNA 2',3'-cyclic 3'-phosphodiesterase